MDPSSKYMPNVILQIFVIHYHCSKDWFTKSTNLRGIKFENKITITSVTFGSKHPISTETCIRK